MKDVEKTNVERNNSSKRMRRRKRKMNLYGLIVILLVLTVGITISYTFLFNINEIRVSGESDQYTAEEIVIASGISKGDNLLRLNTSKSEQNILDNLLYVETASIDRDFPSSLEINVTKCIPAYNVSYDMGTLLVSKKGKILADNGFITEGLPIIYGYEPSVTTPGKMIESSDEQKSEAFMEIIENLNSAEENIVSSVDMSDKYSIIVNYSNGIIFKMGNWTDIEYKLNMAWDVMNNEYVEGKTGYITMIGSNQCSFRSSDDPVYIPGVTPDTTETDTDTDSDDEDSEDDEETTTEVYDEDAEMFREYNEQNNTESEDEDENDDSE
ncbi:MAG: FtsQ-type POTRA domain-containing protein [Ruminococcus sp.]|nr:FtsQ-type POTRA domain-containing protein [Ruminococcus sp.]MCD7810808.1 FtsQ-type POTRA domain-containing protein [Ruminococcus sp.]